MNQSRKFTISRVPLDRQGYDTMGGYWGVDMPLWFAMSVDGTVDHYVRAHDRDGARHAIRLIYPDARFFR
jgi:hypothetical protein